ncbi:MAG: class I SAM-dependent methyltransferase [Herpetosiphon sp.]
MYERYAEVYDRTGQLRFSVLTTTYFPDLLRQHKVHGNDLIDLACGTGTFAIAQSELGWNVTGIDRSPHMLEFARRKASDVVSGLDWVHGDLCALDVEAAFDVATCWYDSLNYLLEEAELVAAFTGIYRALRPNGLFCFDIATHYFLEHYWQGVDVYEDRDYIQVMQSQHLGAGRSLLRLTGWMKQSHGTWERYQEDHTERGYALGVWEAALKQAGFTVEGMYECFTLQAPVERSLRVCFVARKPPVGTPHDSLL